MQPLSSHGPQLTAMTVVVSLEHSSLLHQDLIRRCRREVRLDVCVCICAYLLYHVFMYNGCHRFPILPMVAFQQSSETAETRREACLTPCSIHWGFPLPVWSGFNLSSSAICFSFSFLALVCLASFLPADLEMTFFYYLLVITMILESFNTDPHNLSSMFQDVLLLPYPHP